MLVQQHKPSLNASYEEKDIIAKLADDYSTTKQAKVKIK